MGELDGSCWHPRFGVSSLFVRPPKRTQEDEAAAKLGQWAKKRVAQRRAAGAAGGSDLRRTKSLPS